MRPSKRGQALEAAIRVVRRDGIISLSYDAVAAEAGLTKGGLAYHFPSRDALLRALHEHVSRRWETHMAQEASAGDERLDTYVRGSAGKPGHPDRAELQLMMQAIEDRASADTWNRLHGRWAPPAPEERSDEQAMHRFLARLAADGLWLYETLADQPLEPQLRKELFERISALG